MTLAYVGLPLLLFVVTRSTKWTILSIVVVFALAGSLVQASVGLGIDWTLLRLQFLVLGLLMVTVGLGVLRARARGLGSTPVARQIWSMWIPAAAIGLLFLILRMLAAPDPGPLANIGFLVSQTVAEDNAKWLNLSSLLVAGQPLSFAGGYAGGPYLLVLTVAVTFASAVSQLIFGGINEVAAASGGVIAAGFLLVALIPFAFAPLVESSWRSGKGRGRYRLPPTMLVASMVPLVAASLAVGGFGHQSLQLVMFVLVLWITTFLSHPSTTRERLVATIAAVSAGVIWFPLNAWAVALLIASAAWVARTAIQDQRQASKPPWISIALVIVAIVSYWDGLVSSLVYALGIGGAATGVSATGSGAGLGVTAMGPVPANTASLFASPGGTEQLTAILSLVAALSAIAAALRVKQLLRSQGRTALALAPIGTLVGYAILISFADAVLTGDGSNYATVKMIFLVGMVALASTLALALSMLDPWSNRTTVLPWVGMGALVLALSADSLLPRAIATVGPQKWEAPPPDSVPYWTTFEVLATSQQDIDTVPIGCVYLPPGADKPTGNIDGQLTYACTRLLIGLNGAEGKVGSLMDWIGTDWLANGSYWDDWYGNLQAAPDAIKSKRIILLDEDGGVIGFETLQGLLDRFPPKSNLDP